MTDKQSRSQMTQRRGRLLVELFLENLRPLFATRSDADDFPYDYLVGFTNARGGVNTFAVQFKATDRPVSARHPLSRSLRDRLANSNIPVLFLVVDATREELFYGWPGDRDGDAGNNGNPASLALTKVDDATRRQLRKRLVRADRAPAAVA